MHGTGQWDHGQLAVPMEEWQCAVAAESAHAAAQAASRWLSSAVTPPPVLSHSIQCSLITLLTRPMQACVESMK